MKDLKGEVYYSSSLSSNILSMKKGSIKYTKLEMNKYEKEISAI
jgi:hypothetical protein